MTAIEFPFGIGQAIRIEGENTGEVRGLWVDYDGIKWVQIRYKDDTGVRRLSWQRCSDCEGAEFTETSAK